MNNFNETQLHTLRDINLSSIEKAEIRDSLTHFMASHPLPRVTHKTWFSRIALIPSPYTGISMKMTKVLVFSFICIIGIGSGLTFASANAIPGQLLYPIKINIKEEIEGSLKTEPEEKLVWKEQKVTRRIAEIKTLKAQKQVTKREATIAQAVLQKHVAELNETFGELKEEDKDAILATTAQLIPHTETLNTETSTDLTTQTTPEPVLMKTSANTETTLSTDTLPEENLLDAIEGDDTEKLKVALTQEVNKQIQKIKDSAELAAKDTIEENSTETKTEVEVKKDTINKLPGAVLPTVLPTTTPVVTEPTTTLPTIPITPTTSLKGAASSLFKNNSR